MHDASQNAWLTKAEWLFIQQSLNFATNPVRLEDFLNDWYVIIVRFLVQSDGAIFTPGSE